MVHNKHSTKVVIRFINILVLYLLYFFYADDIIFRPKDASSNQPSFALVGYLGHAIIGCLAMRQA
jgi:hypothetical protein